MPCADDHVATQLSIRVIDNVRNGKIKRKSFLVRDKAMRAPVMK
jgi:hypothetical protein